MVNSNVSLCIAQFLSRSFKVSKLYEMRHCLFVFMGDFFLRVCLWTGLLLFLLAVLGACTFISRFTRLAGELFGILIAMLFMQEAIRVSKRASFVQLHSQLILAFAPKACSFMLKLYFFRALWMSLVSPEEQIQDQLSFNLLGYLQMECLVWFCLLDFCILH